MGGVVAMWVWFFVVLALVALAYVRLAPMDVEKVHQPVVGDVDRDGKGHCLRVIPARLGALARIDAAMRGLARTSVVAGEVAQGRITYVTRSGVVGFPDFTTVEERDGHIRLFGRLRFGRVDLGVNRARLTQVLEAVAV